MRAGHGLQPGRCGECRWLPWPLRPNAGHRAGSSLGVDSSSYRFYRQDPRIWTGSLRALFILLHRARICFDNFCIKSNGAMVDEKRGSRYSRNTGLILNLNSRPGRTAQYVDLVVPCVLGLLSQLAVCLEPAIHFGARGRCERKSRQTRPSPKAVAVPLSRARTKYGAICVATRRAGANSPHFFVARHSQTPGMRHSSLLEIGKIGSQRRPRES